MFAPTIRRTLLEARSTLPPTFLLPFRARITTVSHSLETGNVPEPLIQSGHRISEAMKGKTRTPKESKVPSPTPTQPPTVTPPPPATPDNVSLITPEIRQLLPYLRAQEHHYLTIHIHGRPYLVTQGDTVRLPFLMPKVRPGDVLRLNRATHIGSRDFTLKAPAPQKGTADQPKKVFYLDERLFDCRATVLGVESEPMRIMEKTKRRQRYVRTVKSKHRFTMLKISEIRVKSLEEVEGAVKSGAKEAV